MSLQNNNNLAEASEICEKIHHFVRMSKLDFMINQTPYSSYITVRRKFQKNALDENISLNVDTKNTEDTGSKGKNEALEKENRLLQSQNENLQKDINDVKKELLIVKRDTDSMTFDLKGQNKALEKGNRILQSQSENLQKDLNKLKKELLIVKKEGEDHLKKKICWKTNLKLLNNHF